MMLFQYNSAFPHRFDNEFRFGHALSSVILSSLGNRHTYILITSFMFCRQNSFMKSALSIIRHSDRLESQLGHTNRESEVQDLICGRDFVERPPLKPLP